MTTTISENIVSLDGLTKTDIAALRKADDVCAVLHDGEHKLRCIKRADWKVRERDPFATDQRIDIDVEGRVTNYEKGEPYPQDYSGFTNLYGSEGIWEIVRPGDRIHLDWIRGNYSEWMREHAPTTAVDSLTIRVTREVRGKRKELRFQAAYQCGAKNSARLIRNRSEGFV